MPDVDKLSPFDDDLHAWRKRVLTNIGQFGHFGRFLGQTSPPAGNFEPVAVRMIRAVSVVASKDVDRQTRGIRPACSVWNGYYSRIPPGIR